MQGVVIGHRFGEVEGGQVLLHHQVLERVLSHFGQVASSRDVAVQQPHSERSKRLLLSFVNEVSVEDSLKFFLCADQATLACSVSSFLAAPTGSLRESFAAFRRIFSTSATAMRFSLTA